MIVTQLQKTNLDSLKFYATIKENYLIFDSNQTVNFNEFSW